MPKRRESEFPSYSFHKGSGQAVVRLDGRDIYLGVYASRESREKFDRLTAEWLVNGRRMPDDPNDITIAQVVAAFRRHAKTFYADADGNVSRAVANIDEALKPLVKLYGTTPAAEFGPLRLKTVRNALIEDGRVRQNVNRHIVRIRGVFKWAVENELIPASVFHGLMALAGLRAGRSGAKEGESVKPVPVEYVEPVIPHVSRQVASMIRLQLLTGMRPGEVVIMRGMDLDTTGALWIYRPSKHKTMIHGINRDVYLGPKAQEIIKPFLRMNPTEYLFDPRDAERERREKLHAERKTPLSCGNKPGSNRQRKPKRKISEQYTSMTYYRAVQRGCVKAGVMAWHPHQLRHTAATELRKTHGLEAAQVILGHRTLTVTQVYAEKNVAAAMKIMQAVG